MLPTRIRARSVFSWMMRFDSSRSPRNSGGRWPWSSQALSLSPISLSLPAEAVANLADRHHVWMILSHRYPHGIRGVAGFAYGMTRLSWPRFLVLNAGAAGLWAVAIVSIGYGFGHVSESTLNNASSKLGLVMLAVFLGLSWYLSKRLEQVIERKSTS